MLKELSRDGESRGEGRWADSSLHDVHSGAIDLRPAHLRALCMPPLKDLTGESIAGLTISGRAGTSRHGHTLWSAVCERCGSTVTKATCELRRLQRTGSQNGCQCIREKGLVGQTFGLITVTRRLPPRQMPSGRLTYMYEGICQCGNKVVRAHSNMKQSQACRQCLANDKTIDLTDITFGRLVVIARHGSDKHGRATWRCRCNCKSRNPNYVVVSSRELLKGDTQSCNCWHDESASIRAAERIRNSVYAEWACPFYRGRRLVSRMRKSWEIMFARYLDLKGWCWEYEPATYLLPSGRHRYIPDFEVRCPYGTVFFDVKGWKRPSSMKKIEAFSQLHRIAVVDRNELIRLTGMRPELFKKHYEAQQRWAYRGLGPALFKARRIPGGLR
jgi:hypothetical protein